MRKKQKYINPPGTPDIIFEIHEKNELDESGNKPIIIKLEPEEKKKKQSLT
jgi:hypothetical protein